MMEKFKEFTKWLFHDKLGWHKPIESWGWDGASFTATCKICGKRILRDSQGGWFLASWQPEDLESEE